jgi:uncharacterized membrane protein
MKKLSVLFAILSGANTAYGCTSCNPDVQRAIFDSTFYPNLFTMMLAFIILVAIIIILALLTARNERKHHLQYGHKLTIVPLVSAATTLGIGIGGFIDGTILHQILQWHEMLSNKIPPVTLINKSVNMFWDGIFHLFCLVTVIVGLFMLAKLFFRNDVIVTWKAFIGGLFLGWGIFNIVEGIVDHHILKLHNVREITPDIDFWNFGFLGLSVLFLLIGFFLIRAGSPSHLYEKRNTI